MDQKTAILFDNGIKEREPEYWGGFGFGGYSYGDTQEPFFDLIPDSPGIERAFGFEFTGAPSGGPLNQDWSKNVLGTIDFDVVGALLRVHTQRVEGRYEIGKNGLDADAIADGNAKEIYKLTKHIDKTGSKIRSVNELLQESLNVRHCSSCGKNIDNRTNSEYMGGKEVIPSDTTDYSQQRHE